MWQAPEALAGVFDVLLRLLPGVLWGVWWLWAVNWHKLWPVLARGGWAPVVLLMLVATLVWSRMAPTNEHWLPNVWWQLFWVCALAAVALFCGWLQGRLGWAPPEYSVEPLPVSHDHAHGHH